MWLRENSQDYLHEHTKCSELNKRYPFPRILHPVLASKLFLCFTKILLPLWLIVFQTSAQATLGKVPGGLPVNLFKFSSSCKTPTGQASSQPPFPFAGEMMICTLREINLLCSNTYPGTIARCFPGVPTPLPPDKPWGNRLGNPLLGPQHLLGEHRNTFSLRRESHPQLTCTPFFLRLNLFISEIQRSMLNL